MNEAFHKWKASFMPKCGLVAGLGFQERLELLGPRLQFLLEIADQFAFRQLEDTRGRQFDMQ